MDEIAHPVPAEGPDGTEQREQFDDHDPVAASRALERAAARMLTSGGLDARTAHDITTACEQLAADRTNGENLEGPINQLRELLERATDRFMHPGAP
jgi:Cdc6-like AAA superfamily ATPase